MDTDDSLGVGAPPCQTVPHLVGGCSLEPSQVRSGPSGWCPELEWPRAPFVPSYFLNSSSRTPAARGFSWATAFAAAPWDEKGRWKENGKLLTLVMCRPWEETWLDGRRWQIGGAGRGGRHQERLRLELGLCHGPPLGPAGQG